MRGIRLFWIWFFFALAGGAHAGAHPLGNFTVNHLAKITASPRALHVRYILDIAEIPTFQIMHRRSNGDWTSGTLAQWANEEIPAVQSGFHLRVDGLPQALSAVRAHARLRPGAGGLPILRWVGEFNVPLTASATHRVAIDDGVYADRRIGWKDIIVGKQTEPTDELQRYPSALLGSPRRVSGASFVVAGGSIAKIQHTTDAAPQAGSLTAWVSPTALSDMFSRHDRTPLFILFTILTAFGLGALHAIEPGHGKALLAFTLVGARATAKQALILAGSLTFAHTIGVLLLGAALFFAAGFVSETVYPWITLLSGLAVVLIGARALSRFVRVRRGNLSHAHSHAHDHPHEHAHEHEHGHSHSHTIRGTQPLNFGSAITAAMSGGIAPCPAAIVVLLAALRLHQLAYGMVLIVIFSMGLATVLSALGIAVVHGASWLSQRSAYPKIAALGPLLSALVISSIGAWMLGQGFTQVGIAASSVAIAALALAAVAAYALLSSGYSPRHPHRILTAMEHSS